VIGHVLFQQIRDDIELPVIEANAGRVGNSAAVAKWLTPSRMLASSMGFIGITPVPALFLYGKLECRCVSGNAAGLTGRISRVRFQD
jgi:hypothetical protein